MNGAAEIILFDLDNTLYPAERELFSLIDKRINHYMHKVVGIPAEQVDSLRRRYWRDYGVTMQGLMRHHQVDPEDYLHYVHDVDVRSRLQPDPQLRRTLAALPQRRMIFTNSSLDHTERVLDALGVRDMFERVFDIRVAGYLPKPYAEPYREILAQLGRPGAACIMVEDNVDNLQPAKKLGMTTVLVGNAAPQPYVDVHLPAVHQVASALQKRQGSDAPQLAGGVSG
jgi:putative hydrolase of the HAD superfamily